MWELGHRARSPSSGIGLESTRMGFCASTPRTGVGGRGRRARRSGAASGVPAADFGRSDGLWGLKTPSASCGAPVIGMMETAEDGARHQLAVPDWHRHRPRSIGCRAV